MNEENFAKKGFTISTDKNLLDLEMIHNYLDNESYWAQGISKDTISRSIENSMCFGVYKSNVHIGLARVVSDKATFAYICDVFIHPSYRRLGLSKWLIQTIINDPELAGLRRWSLATADAHGLYKQFGFKEINRPDRWMEIFTPYPSKQGR